MKGFLAEPKLTLDYFQFFHCFSALKNHIHPTSYLWLVKVFYLGALGLVERDYVSLSGEFGGKLDEGTEMGQGAGKGRWK